MNKPLVQPSEPPSYWQTTTQHMPLASVLPSTAEVVVIGGGIVGASTCYWLARMGKQVVLLERTAVAAGATGRNGGFITIGLATAYQQAIEQFGEATARAILHLTQDNLRLVRQVITDEYIECDYREPGHLELALHERQFREQEQAHLALQHVGVTTHLLTRQQTQQHIATPLGVGIVGSLFTPGTALVHPVRLVDGLLRAAQRYGARIVQSEVFSLTAEGNGVRVETTLGTIQAQGVVVATNARIPSLLPAFKRVITPVRGQVLAYAPVSPVFTAGIGVNSSGTGEYWQQTPDGTLILGGCRAVAPDGERNQLASTPTQVVQTALEALFPRLFPALTGLSVQQRWAGLMAFTPDHLPVVDRVPHLPAVQVVGGFSGHGMPFAMRLGQLVAEAVDGSEPPALAPFRLSRPTLAPE